MHAQNPIYQMFQMRRVKVAELHRQRRQHLFEQSRKFLQQNQSQQKQINEADHQSRLQENLNEQQRNQSLYLNGSTNIQQQSSMSIPHSQEQFIFVEEKHIEKGLQCIDAQINTNPSNQKEEKKINFNNKYNKMIQSPSWMTTVPQDMQKFYGLARPDGNTGLLLFMHGCIHIYDKFGKKIPVSIFTQISNLQKNPIKKLLHSYQGTFLQVTFNRQKKQVFITDVLYWKFTVMTTQSFQFRYAWLLSNIGHIINNLSPVFKIKLVEYYLMDNCANLQKIYTADFGYQKQGLLFVHKQSPYIHGYNEDAIIWKDAHTSKYPKDERQSKTKKQGTQMEKEYIYGTGKFSRNGSVYSIDKFKLGHIKLYKNAGCIGGFVKFRITGVQFSAKNNAERSQNDMDVESQNNSMNITLKDFQLLEFKKNGKADPLSRIIFQHRIRRDPLTIQQIANKLNKK